MEEPVPDEAPDETLSQIQDIQCRIEQGDSTVVPVLVKRVQRSSDKLLRRLLARTASMLAEPEHLRTMAKLYLDHDPQVRLWSLGSISRHEDYSFYPLFVRAYLFDEDRRVRSACRRVLQRLSPSQMRTLLDHMEGNEKEWMREAARTARPLLRATFGRTVSLGSTSRTDLDIVALEDGDLGPRGNYVPPEEDVTDLDLAGMGEDEPELEVLGEDGEPLTEEQLNAAWRQQRSDRKKDVGIAEAIAKDGKVSQDNRTFTRRDCPHCGERIMVEAILCRYCNEVFREEELAEVMALAKVKVVPLPIRSPSHRGSALVLDVAVSMALTPVFGLGLVYLLLKDGVRGGRSLGKAVYRMRVVDMDSGEPCSIKQSLVRNWFLLVPFFPLIEVILLAATGNRTGDQSARTRVVFTDDPPATAVLAAAVMMAISLLCLTVMFGAIFGPGGASWAP